MKFTDSDLLYEMIECLNFHEIKTLNDGFHYAQGEFDSIECLKSGSNAQSPYAALHPEKFENNTTKGFWKYYV